MAIVWDKRFAPANLTEEMWRERRTKAPGMLRDLAGILEKIEDRLFDFGRWFSTEKGTAETQTLIMEIAGQKASHDAMARLHDCGTVACAAGWATIAPWAHGEDGWSLSLLGERRFNDRSTSEPYVRGPNGFEMDGNADGLGAFFGLTRAEAHSLFISSVYSRIRPRVKAEIEELHASLTKQYGWALHTSLSSKEIAAKKCRLAAAEIKAHPDRSWADGIDNPTYWTHDVETISEIDTFGLPWWAP